MVPLVWSRFRRLGLALLVMGPLLCTGRLPVLASSRVPTDAYASLPTLHWPGMVSVQWYTSLDPAQTISTTDDQVVAMVNASLVKRLPNGKIVPYLASSWKISQDHLTYTFTLRKGLRFSNGDKLTSTDVVYSLKRYVKYNTAGATVEFEGAADYHNGKIPDLTSVKALNAATVQIKASTVDAFFVDQFQQNNIGIVLDHKVLEGKNATQNDNYLTNTCSGNVGAGPFKFVCRNTSSDLSSFYPSGTTPGVELVPNKYFYGKKPTVKLSIQTIKDNQTALLDYEAGQLDATFNIPSTSLPEVQHQKGFFKFPTYLVWWVAMAVDMPPFDNIHCRLAVAYAINTDQIDKTVLHGAWAPLHAAMPKPLIGYYNGKDNPQYNAKKARSELAQCPGGIHDQKLLYEGISSDFDNVFGGAIPAQLAAVGIDVKGNGQPRAAWIKVATSSQKSTGNPIIHAGLTSNNPNAWCLFRTTGYLLNTADYSNSHYDAICPKALRTFNLKKRATLYRQAGHMIMAAGTFVPVGQVVDIAVTKKNLKGVTGDPLFNALAPKDYDWSNVTISKK